MNNNLVPFKHRSLNFAKPVSVYRNLHGSGVNKYSVLQNGLVVAHTDRVMLHNCNFVVNKNGQAKVRAEGRKNVHAFIRGRIAIRGGMGTDAFGKLPAKITYNPYTDNTFVVRNLTLQPEPVKSAMCAIINQHGVTAAYIG